MPAQKSKEETIRHQVLDAKCLKIRSGAKVFCSVCNKSFTCNKTNHVPDHLEGKNHSEALLLKKPRQSILVPSGSQVEDNFNRKKQEIQLPMLLWQNWTQFWRKMKVYGELPVLRTGNPFLSPPT